MQRCEICIQRNVQEPYRNRILDKSQEIDEADLDAQAWGDKFKVWEGNKAEERKAKQKERREKLGKVLPQDVGQVLDDDLVIQQEI